jgi:hypothetical protein
MWQRQEEKMSAKKIQLSELSLNELLQLRSYCQSGQLKLNCSQLCVLQAHIDRRIKAVESLERVLETTSSQQAA